MNEPPVPSDVEAEEAVLGSLLIDTEAITRIAGVLQPHDFYREKHGWIYAACQAVSDRFEATDELTVKAELERSNRLDAVGGIAFLYHLASRTPTAVHVDDYAKIVHACAVQRTLIQAAGQIARAGYEGGDTSSMLAKAYEELLRVSGMELGSGFRSLAQIAAAERAQAEEWVLNPKGASGTPTKLADVDRLLGGLKGSIFYVLAARPSIGKSQFALTLAVNVARQGKTVGLFSLEMSAAQSWQRLVLAQAQLNEHAIRNGTAPVGWQNRYWKAWDEMAKLGIHLDDATDITTGTMRARATQLRARWPNLGLLIVDYAQIASDAEMKSEELRISRITNRLRAIGRHLNVPLLAVYQLSRNVEARDNRMPQLSDLRYSGQIEQDADVVLMLYRKAYYHSKEPGNERFNLLPGEEFKMDVLVEKNRHGPTGVLTVWYNPATGEIKSWAEESRYAR